jgi:phosphoribosylformimino-5-aminoimidazole carboxamide ribotide isomerase
MSGVGRSMHSLRVLPVIDLMRGEVVRAVGGRREEYRRLVDGIATSSDPCDIAGAFRSHFDFREFYLADLDAVLGGEPAFATYSELHKEGFRLWVDAGVCDVTRACQLREAGIESIIIGLETVVSPAALAEIVRAFGDQIVFSLDLHQGQPLGDHRAWGKRNAWEIAVQAVELGVRRMLVLDLAHVGCGEGTGNLDLCGRLHADFPQLEIGAGGGIRDRRDLLALRGSGVRVAVVASALHAGRLTRADLEGL